MVKMNLKVSTKIVISLIMVVSLVAFCVGLNLGMHGAFYFEHSTVAIHNNNHKRNSEIINSFNPITDNTIIISNSNINNNINIDSTNSNSNTNNDINTNSNINNNINTNTNANSNSNNDNIKLQTQIPSPTVESNKNNNDNNVQRILDSVWSSPDVMKVLNTKLNDINSNSNSNDIESYIKNKGRIPIVLLTCNRPEFLEKTLGIIVLLVLSL